MCFVPVNVEVKLSRTDTLLCRGVYRREGQVGHGMVITMTTQHTLFSPDSALHILQ